MIGTAPIKKLIAHIIVAFILVVMANLRIESMHGIFGIYDTLSLWQSYLLSLFVYLVIINAINLIDGINGLAMMVFIIIYLYLHYFLNAAFNIFIFIFYFFIFFNFFKKKYFLRNFGSLII